MCIRDSRFAAYLNLVQEPAVLFGLAPCGSACFIPFMETSGSTITVRHIGYFLLRCQPSLAIHLRIASPVRREEFPLPWQRSRFSSHGMPGAWAHNLCFAGSFLVVAVMAVAMMAMRCRIQNPALRPAVAPASMVILRTFFP